MKKYPIVLFALAILITGCWQPENRSRGVYLLLDTSGTYALELTKAKSIINYLLGTLNPGDTFAVASIDTGSFSEKDIIAKMTFDQRPSTANNQKRLFLKNIEGFIQNVSESKFTDISGGVLQAIEYLNEAGAGKKHVLIFSDLKEELDKGHIRDVPFKLDGFNIIALNVTKLRADIKDPKQYMERVEKWKGKVESGGGHWRVINDLERLDNIFSK